MIGAKKFIPLFSEQLWEIHLLKPLNTERRQHCFFRLNKKV
jgi:hypothetical protein